MHGRAAHTGSQAQQRPRLAPAPSLLFEAGLWQDGIELVAGVDEAGRGPLAGPVVAAAVILERGFAQPWIGAVRDSKMLSAAERERLAPLIRRDARAAGVGIVSAARIDRLGILPATRLAMDRAIAQLGVQPQHLLVDALLLGSQPAPQTALLHGDNRSVSIACASILAKVARDRIMAALESVYPGYGFSRHKGYGTPEHSAALEALGPCPIHRRSFSPVASALAAR